MSLDPSGLFCAYILNKHSSSLQGENREHTKIETIYLSHQTVYTLIRGFDFSWEFQSPKKNQLDLSNFPRISEMGKIN